MENRSSCGSLCQHPSCWTSLGGRNQGSPWTPSSTGSNWSSDIKNDLPMQSICNLLSGYGGSSCHNHCESPGGHLSCQCHSALSGSTLYKQRSTVSKQTNITWKSSHGIRMTSRSRSVEAKTVIDANNLCATLNDLYVPKQSYIWISSPKKRFKSHRSQVKGMNPNCALMKDLTDWMMPEKIIQKRQNTVLFAEWPTMKIKRAQSRSQPDKKLSLNNRIGQASKRDTIHSEGFRSPQNPVSTSGPVFLTSKVKLHSLVQDCLHDDARDTFQNKQMQGLSEHTSGQALQFRLVANMDDHQVVSLSTLLNKMPRQKDATKVPGDPKKDSQQLEHNSKMTSVSLGLPELPTGIQTNRPFSYRKQDFNFSFGPMPPLSSNQSFLREDSSHLARAGAPSTTLTYHDNHKHQEKVISMPQCLATHSADPTPAMLEPDLEPEHSPVTSEPAAECNHPSSVSETAPAARPPSIPRTNDDPPKEKILTETLTTESPAPPPPSPEPRP